jgi:hypothetical protein
VLFRFCTQATLTSVSDDFRTITRASDVSTRMLAARVGNVLHLTSQSGRIDLWAGVMFQSGQLVRVNQAAVTDAVGHIVRQTSEEPPKYLVKLLFSFRGVSEVELPADRIRAQG